MTMIVMITVMLMRGGFIASDGDIWPAKLTAGTIYNDTCDFSDYLYNVSERNVKCGDKCINWEADCFCGSDIFRPYDNEEQCCITSKMRCTKDDGKYISDRDGVCSQGKKLPMSIKCDNPTRSLQCHNSYQDSKYMLGSALTSPVPKPVSPCLVTCAAVWTGVGQISGSADLTSDAMRHVIPLIVIKMAQNSASTPVLHPAIIIVIMKTRMFPGNSTVLIEQTKFKTHHWTL